MIVKKLNIKKLIATLKEADKLGYNYIDIECFTNDVRDEINFHIYPKYKKQLDKEKIKKKLNNNIINQLLLN